jgi:hypothetical protein
MTDQEAIDFYNELVEHFGDSLPNFEHEPIRFAYCVKLYKYYKERK